jgi:hypothetical protein
VAVAARHLLERARHLAERYGGNSFFAKPFELDDAVTAVQGPIGEA